MLQYMVDKRRRCALPLRARDADDPVVWIGIHEDLRVRRQHTIGLTRSLDSLDGGGYPRSLNDYLARIRIQRIKITRPEVQPNCRIIFNPLAQVLGEFSDGLLIRDRQSLFRPPCS